MRNLKTAQDVVDTLGGLPAVCELTGANIKQAWNWVGRAEAFPASTYVIMQRKLHRRGARASAWLWNMRGVEKRAAKRKKRAAKRNEVSYGSAKRRSTNAHHRHDPAAVTGARRRRRH